MELDGILIMHSQSGLPLYSRLEDNIDEVLFSGLLTAIKSFISELSLGGLSSFSTDEKYFYLNGRESITTCLISDKEIDFKDVYSLSLEIGSKFESMFGEDITGSVNVSTYKKFDSTLQSILATENDISYDIQVADFVKKEFGENLAYKTKLKNNDGKYITIDLLVDNGVKSSGITNKVISRVHKAFSRDTTFVKIVDGVAGRAEVMQFFELAKTFGGRLSGSSDPEVYHYFPRKVVVIARDYSSTVFEDLKGLKRQNDKSYIPATHILPTAGFHTAPGDMKCYVELWKWQNNDYPERIFS